MTRTPIAAALLLAGLGLAGLGLAGCATGTATSPAAQGTTRTVTGSAATGTPRIAPTFRVSVPPPPGQPGRTTAPRTPTAGSGIAGLTTIDGGCPVLRAESPCPSRVVTARLSIVDGSTGAVVATVSSGADGRFVVAVRPGRYLIRLVSIAGGPPHPQNPATVTVSAGRYTAITLRFDTGIR
ncbi:MAG: hypothetical protein V7603_2602 [Micromonosporaceae bacterium]